MDWGQIFSNGVEAAVGQEAVIYALAALGLNIHFGYTGLLNFGQVGFMAIASYGLAISVTSFSLPFFVAVLIGLAAAAVLALLLGVPTLRLRADYLAIVTIASAEIIRLVARSPSTRKYSGGSGGLTAFSQDFYELNPYALGSYDFGPFSFSERQLWVLTVFWTLTVLVMVLTFLLMRSPWGRVLKSIREDEDAARALGKNVVAYKMQSLVLGGLCGALAGFCFSLGTGSLQPDSYSNFVTFFAYCALILGGPARVFGPVVGSMIFWLMLSLTENILRQAVGDGLIPAGLMDSNQVGVVRFMLVGLGLMLLAVFRPQGIFGDRRELALDAR